MEFAGKHVLVTGGALRVGAALCRAFAAAGAQLTIHCRSSVAAAEALAAELPGTGHTVAVADFTPGEAGAAELWGQLARPVDVLVNNASCYRLPAERAAEYETVNHLAPRELMRRFAEQDLSEGAVVNFLDQAVLNPNSAEDPIYVASRRGPQEIKSSKKSTIKMVMTWEAKRLALRSTPILKALRPLPTI